MKRSMFVAVLAGCLVGTAEAGTIHQHQHRQHARIRQGVQDGTLDPGEARALRAEQRQIGAERREAWADGRLSAGEARDLHRRQQAASRHIHRLRRDSR